MEKWHKWRDYRHTPKIAKRRLQYLVEHSAKINQAATSSDGTLDHIKLADAVMYRVASDFDFKFCPLPFKGMSSDVDAFCDFNDGDHTFVRPKFEDAFYGDWPIDDPMHQQAIALVTHDFGHPIAGHGSVLRKKYSGSGKGTHLRLAHNTRVLTGPKDWMRCYTEADEPELEFEADIVSWGLRVPITGIRYVLDMNVEDGVAHLIERFGVPDHDAYNAALLAKDYFRSIGVRLV
ncbi:MAG: hypothetical protein AAFR73_05760 [Pseudomonadota bacterium]